MRDRRAISTRRGAHTGRTLQAAFKKARGDTHYARYALSRPEKKETTLRTRAKEGKRTGGAELSLCTVTLKQLEGSTLLLNEGNFRLGDESGRRKRVRKAQERTAHVKRRQGRMGG